ncbi:MAG TPA: ABC transporter substrate-binding protein [Candidatus Binatia bacterium]|jgi:4,5-dihydroxyphthalate decarboxylase|nr:ABC transporter substrate-binding protein [Candidatus Binatia bacterium]
MSKLKLSLACGYYDLLRPLIEGVVKAPGIDLNILTMASPERHGRMLRHEEFDLCELSLVSYLVAWDQSRRFTAIPVFPHRRFRHGYMVRRMKCGIERPADLNGKRVGLDTLQNSAGLWMRGILQDHYGVDLKSIEWWCQEEEDIPFEPAKLMRVRRVPKGRDIDQMLLEGELEGALYPETLPSIKSGSPKVGLLFPNSKEAEADYYRKSGIFPIMHAVVIKNAILEKDPWVAVSLLQAFQRSKEICYERMRDPRNFALVWVKELMLEQEAVFGPDPWPYNVEDNRKALEAVVRYEFDQGMIKKKPKIEQIFFPASLQEVQHYV